MVKKLDIDITTEVIFIGFGGGFPRGFVALSESINWKKMDRAVTIWD
jgi:hypothetical protein